MPTAHTPTPPEPVNAKQPEFDEFRGPDLGERLGNVTVLEVIGAGGMATVYKVKHEELEVIRAVKMLRPGCGDESKKRLLTEAKISAHLDHPNIVHIYNVAVWKNALPYIEMEYVDGVSLSDILKKRKQLPFVVALAVARIICDALDYAQQQTFTVYGKEYFGLVHRDIKPANILISHTGHIKLGDFGIALPQGVSIHTMGPDIMGTYPYLSPEQLNSERLDPRTDLYSLGAVLYEMVTGIKAFPQKILPELLQAKTQGAYRPLNSVLPDVPSAVERIIAKSMSVDREKRFRDAEQMADVLDEALGELTHSTSPAVVKQYLSSSDTRWVSTSLTAVTHHSSARFIMLWIVSLLSLAAAVGGIIWAVDHFVEPPKTSRAEKPAIAAPGTEKLPSPELTIRTDNSKEFDPTPPPRRRSGSAHKQQSGRPLKAGLNAFHAGEFSRAIPLLSGALEKTDDEHLKTILRIRLFECYLEAGDYAEARATAEGEPIDDGYFFLLRARTLHHSGRYRQAEQALIKAQTTKSVFGDHARKEAVYLWAVNRQAMYRQKPNMENKGLALRAWKNFAKAFCTDDATDKRCTEAAGHIARLGD
mgnify:CR=1 FL=1